ncbi:type III secretion system protein,Flagellar motor switch/type III secretory pathway protein,type III secretion apparatus protein, YscQ/HrcQ family,Surface presentation of antigens (SPOA) [Chlamydia serpentis]|uniref:Type III secretion system protein,Flagellar motor switch/type III secretory pathway protein,type III secretion apparatus protein, YscQ/HrcQ family,Surface presentation of antigens (SPOA) n=1 Tax=Chlamydia serpentis TaxID=1967782 RepID=A0A2R8FBX7_9CHLA|nr:type III secretion system cytoplasmic ring protein SctQ [Chlamydia serpentis]SPN73822.1 type III secretion system protein,Flagellar motor switch/type III secretory pathway protein,type III secretion apparatus protein, YscQ/HrcQ family,Surface presentation of antigens (SPOA) [Chlamydia serpentis]
MAVTADPSASWLKSRNSFLRSLGKSEEQIAAPQFPKELSQHKIREKFRIEDVQISISFRGSITALEATKEFGLHLLIQPMVVQPWEVGTILFLTSEEDLQELMVAVFDDASLASYFYEKDKLLGFHYYFVAEICKLFEELQWVPSLSAKVAGEALFTAKSLKGSYQVVDISLRLDGKNVHFRLLLPQETFQSSQKFFSDLSEEADFHNIDQTQLLSLSVEVGYSQLTQEEWHQVVPGSFIMLDSCLYDPETEESGALLTVQNHQFFGGRFLSLSSGEFKITSYPNLAHEDPPLPDNQPAPAAPLPGYSKLVVEVARYSLAVDEFIKLNLGSVLNLRAHPAHGIDIILDGAKVGRGEIIALGDVLGIRVLEV